MFACLFLHNHPSQKHTKPIRKGLCNNKNAFMLPKKYRLTARGDFKEVFSGPLRARAGPLQLICRKNGCMRNRFGFVVSLAVSKKAVHRNLLRRRLHASVQNILSDLPNGYDCVLRAHPGAADEPFNNIVRHVEEMFRKAGMLQAPRE